MRPDFRIYKVETTNDWREDIRAKVDKLYAVYVFDANRETYACELTPSFEMRYLGPTWTGKLDSPDDDDWRQELFEEIVDGGAESDDIYVHVRSVNLAECEQRTFSEAQWQGFLEDEDGDYEKAWEAALETQMEYCQGNGYTY